MVQTVKFSQFLPAVDVQAGDIIVGLRDGKNQQFNADSIGGGGNTVTIVQNNDFEPGHWLYIDATATYQKATATSLVTSNVVGVVIEATPTDFILQFVGHLEDVAPTFLGAPFTEGGNYFLSADPMALGTMTTTEPTGAGVFSMPVFYAEGMHSGYVHQSRQKFDSEFAPSDDRYIVQQADPDNLPNAQSLGDLNSGIVYNTQVGDVGTLSTLPVVPLELGGTNTPLLDPGKDALFGWDNGTHQANFLGIGTGLAISGGNLINTGNAGADPVLHIVTNNTTPHGYTDNDIGLALRVDASSTTAQPVYVKALADTAANAEAVGIFAGKIDDNNYYLQEIGYNNNFTHAVFTGLTAGQVYFLSDQNLGELTDTAPTTPGHVSKPMVVAEGSTSGWIYSMRGVIIGDTPTPPAPGENSLLQQTVTQANTFVLGDIVRLSTNGSPPPDALYVLADATTQDGVQSVGMIVEIVTPGMVFVVQQSGYVGSGTGAVTGLTPGRAYYLDPANPGKLTITEPTKAGQYSKLAFITDTAGSGWLAEQRERLITGPAGNDISNIVHQVSHGFVPGKWVRIDSSNHYVTAQADSLEHAATVGMVTQKIDDDNFVVQQIGWVAATTGLTFPTAAAQYYLDPNSDGDMTTTKPTAVGQVVKEVFFSQNVNEGWIQEHVSELIEGNSGNGAIIQSLFFSRTEQDTITVSGTDAAPNPIAWFTGSITPSATTSKIKFTANMFVATLGGPATVAGLYLTRNGTVIARQTPSPVISLTTGIAYVPNGTSTSNGWNVTIMFVDDPATTSPVTYGISTSGPNFYIGRNGSNTGGAITTWTLEEIA